MSGQASLLVGLEPRRPYPARLSPKGNLVYKLVTTTDPKVLGVMYMRRCSSSSSAA